MKKKIENKKLRVGILFGGKSTEHEVSLQSAQSVINSLNKEKYEIFPIGIDKAGKWHLNISSDYLLNTHDPKRIKLKKSNQEVSLLSHTSGVLADIRTKKVYQKLDVVFPVLHGPYGEDGSVQGLLKLAGIPFVGAGVLGSAVGMDKDVMKRLLRDAKIPISKFIVFGQGDKLSFQKIKKYIGLPMFVKPVNTGSSVGVRKVGNEKEFKQAVQNAFKYDLKIIIEENISGREIECAVLGNENPMVSIPGEVIPNDEFFSYEAKYITENGASIQIPAKISQKKAKEIQGLALKAYKVLNCEGMGRVDFFLKQNGQVLVNEINTIPGPVMFRKVLEESGLPFSKVLDRLIELALERFEKEQALQTTVN